MITSNIDFPASLADVLRDGFKLRPVSPFEKTKMASGRTRSRRMFGLTPSIASVEWTFTESQAAAFEAWFRDSIADGTAWFNIVLRTPIGVKPYLARFNEMYDGTDLLGVSYWRVRAELELFERPLLPKGWGLFPEFIAQSDIIDIALNREWPAA